MTPWLFKKRDPEPEPPTNVATISYGSEFSFGYPEGWRPVTNDELLEIGGAAGESPVRGIGVVAVDASAPVSPMISARYMADAPADERRDLTPANVEAARGQQGRRLLSRAKWLKLDGERGVIVDVAELPVPVRGSDQMVTWHNREITVIHAGTAWFVTLASPAGKFEQCLPAMGAVIATWRWLR